jgi:glycosyltransferase involved in cell wall biosynthesis
MCGCCSSGTVIDERRLRAETAELAGVMWVGFVQPTDLPEVYGLADVMVFPTLGDPHGLVVEEAMAAGLPVISTSAAGDIHARIPEDVAGHIVPPGQDAPLAERMTELAANPARRAAMGAAGRRSAKRFDTNGYAEDFERFVDGVLAAPRRRHPLAAATAVGGRVVLALAKPSTPASPLTVSSTALH